MEAQVMPPLVGVLLACYEDGLRTFLGELLRLSGFVVFPATEPDDTATIYARHQEEIDVALLALETVDHSMLAFKFLQAINPFLCVCVMCPRVEALTIASLIRIGAIGWLPRPVSGEELLRKLREWSERG